MKLVRSLTVLALGASLVATSAASASADELDDGLWYFTETHVAQAQEVATGEGITIAVFDSPINPDVATLAGANIVTEQNPQCPDGTPIPATSTGEDALHATGMAEIIVGNGTEIDGHAGPRGIAPDVTLLHYTQMLPPQAPACAADNDARFAASIRDAIAQGADIFSFSYSIGAPYQESQNALIEAYEAGAIFVAAVPNEYDFALDGWNAVNGVVNVESADFDQNQDRPISDPLLTVVAPGEGIVHTAYSGGGWDTLTLQNGTSNAAGWTAAALALVWSAYPDSTGNQIIQSLIRNTGTEDHELEHTDDRGYGFISIPHMLENDPSQYEDVNPLLREGEDVVPTIAEIAGGAQGADQGSTSADAPPGQADEPASGPSLALVGLLALAVLAVVGAVIAIIISTTRKNRQPPRQGPYQGI